MTELDFGDKSYSRHEFEDQIKLIFLQVGNPLIGPLPESNPNSDVPRFVRDQKTTGDEVNINYPIIVTEY